MPVYLLCSYPECKKGPGGTRKQCKRRQAQITGPHYKPFCSPECRSAYISTPEGKAWQTSWQKPCNVIIPHYAKKKEEMEIEQAH